MKPDAVRYFVCPSCGGELEINSNDSIEIAEGSMDCKSCGGTYQVRRGIPRFVVHQDYAHTFGTQWTRWSRTQHDSLNGTTVFRDRLKRYTGWTLESMRGQVVVDAGCGPGAFIDVIENYADVVVGFDMSQAIDSAYELHGHRSNVYLAQADMFRLPLRQGIADRLFTFGVVQHTPNPELAFRSLIPVVKPGGEIAVWVYRKRLIPQPAFLLRLFTRGMKEPNATRFIEWYVPKAFALAGAVRGIPVVGRQVARLVPVNDYRGILPLRPEQFLEWAYMDTYDGLITKFVYPQRKRDLARWMAGLREVRFPSKADVAAVGIV